MPSKKYTDQELMKLIGLDQKTLNRFKEIQKNTIKEANRKKAGKTIKVLGIYGSARDEFDTSQEKYHSETLLESSLHYCQKLGTKTELILLRNYKIEHCKSCYSTVNTQCHFYCSCYPKGTPQGDDMTNVLYDKILAADAIIFATPVNNFKMSTLMAAFLDRCISLDGSLEPANPKVPKDRELNIKHAKFVNLTADNDIFGSGFLKRFANKVGGLIVTGHEAGASLTISSLFMTLNHFGLLFPPFSNIYAMSSVCLQTYKDKAIIISKCYDEEINLMTKNIILVAQLVKNLGVAAWKTDYHFN